MNYLILFTLVMNFAFASGSKQEESTFKKAAKKIEKRKGYCSPLDKMTGKCKTEEKETDKKILTKTKNKAKEISNKVEKRKDYCSPLDKFLGKCAKKKED